MRLLLQIRILELVEATTDNGTESLGQFFPRSSHLKRTLFRGENRLHVQKAILTLLAEQNAAR